MTVGLEHIVAVIEQGGGSLTLMDDGRVRYSLPAIPDAPTLLETLRQHRDEVAEYLRSRTGRQHSKQHRSDWPPESLENEQRFACYHARLFPFVEHRVWTPVGTGKLYKTGADYSEIVLDASRRNRDGSENRIRVRTKDVRPLQ